MLTVKNYKRALCVIASKKENNMYFKLVNAIVYWVNRGMFVNAVNKNYSLSELQSKAKSRHRVRCL